MCFLKTNLAAWRYNSLMRASGPVPGSLGITMHDNAGNRVNRCQPGYGSSCSFCCGSHNYAMPREEIEELFMDRERCGPGREVLHQETALCEKLFASELQCPNVGMGGDEPGLICCTVYHGHDRGEEFESFWESTCKTFRCPAWTELADREVLFAARLMRDWYWYGLLINDIESLQDLCTQYERPEDVPEEEMELLKERLIEFFIDEDGK